jgi:hypothetical protein
MSYLMYKIGQASKLSAFVIQQWLQRSVYTRDFTSAKSQGNAIRIQVQMTILQHLVQLVWIQTVIKPGENV